MKVQYHFFHKIPMTKSSERHPRILRVLDAVMVCTFVFILLFFLLYSALDTDKTVSNLENRTLASMPKCTIQQLKSGKFMSDFETYYADTFPFRDSFLGVNQHLSSFFSGMKTAEDVVLVEKEEKDDFAGQDMN